MPLTKWKTTPLGELTNNFDSRRVPVRESDRRLGPFPYFGASGIVDWVDDYLFDGEYLLIAEDGENLRTRQTPIAFLGRGKFWVNNHAHIVQGNARANTRYLMYALAAADISAYLSGSTMPKLTQANLNRIPLPEPSLPEQEAIAEVLGSFDETIAINRQKSETLDNLVRTVFQAWFVDFLPVRAKVVALAEGRDPLRAAMSSLSGKDEAELDASPREQYQQLAATAALFPDEMVESELGEVPRGWRVDRLKTHLDVARGLSYQGRGLADSGLPLHNLNSVYEGGGYKGDGIKFYTGQYSNRHVVRSGDVVVANTEQGHDRRLIGYAAIVPERFGDSGLFSQHLYRVRPYQSNSVLPGFVMQLLNSRRMHSVVSGFANGTTVNMLPEDALRAPKFVMPPAPIVKIFEDLSQSILKANEKRDLENQTLAEIRDTLLPKMLSGSVCVFEALELAGIGG